MEGFAWLLIKMAVLLAVTGAAFLALGWWLRARHTPTGEEESPVHDFEQIRTALHNAESSRDSLMSELSSVRSQLSAAEDEVRQLRSAPPPVVTGDAPAELVLQSSVEKVPKPKVPRKPRAKKSKD